MIFVTVGTHTQQFNRLLRELDTMASKENLDLFAQTGNSTYQPHFPSRPFLPQEEYDRLFKSCDLVVSHAGAGTIITALSYRKPLILVPRLREFGEHTNSHQLDLARQLERSGLCRAVQDISNLGKAIKDHKIKPLRPRSTRLREEIERFLREVEA